MRYILDTNVLLSYLRGDKLYQYVERNYAPFTLPNQSFLSIITVGEITSFSLRNQWGTKRKLKMLTALNEFFVLDIKADDIVQWYAQIQAYSQGKLKSKPLPAGMSARNMGDNDIWIAATASVTNTPLLTTDRDFLHLNGIFLDLEWIDIGTL